MTKGSFTPYVNSYGATTGGASPPSAAGPTSQASHVESDETPPHTGSSTDTHTEPPSPSLGASGSMPGMGSQVGPPAGSTAHGPSSPPMPAGMQQMVGNPMNNMNQMGMTGMNEMMANGYGAGMTNNGGPNQWPGNMNMGMTNSRKQTLNHIATSIHLDFGGNCYGPNCNQNFPGPAMSPNNFDYPNAGGNGGMGSNLGQNGAEDYNSAEDSAEVAGGEGIEQANLQRYAEYLNMVNRRYGIVIT